jgi:hypothetical protein
MNRGIMARNLREAQATIEALRGDYDRHLAEIDHLREALERAVPWLQELADVVSAQDSAVALDFANEVRALLMGMGGAPVQTLLTDAQMDQRLEDAESAGF